VLTIEGQMFLPAHCQAVSRQAIGTGALTPPGKRALELHGPENHN
jgi:hypothetical protein